MTCVYFGFENFQGYIENMVKNAYANWNSLQEVDGQLSQTPLLTQGKFV